MSLRDSHLSKYFSWLYVVRKRLSIVDFMVDSLSVIIVLMQAKLIVSDDLFIVDMRRGRYIA